MGIKKMAIVAALGLAMASTPVMAQTSSVERSVAALEEINSQDDGGSDTTTYIVAFFVILAIGLGIYTATDTSNEGQTSP